MSYTMMYGLLYSYYYFITSEWQNTTLFEQIPLAGLNMPSESLFNSKFKIDKKKQQSVLDLKGGRCDNLVKLNLLIDNRL